MKSKRLSSDLSSDPQAAEAQRLVRAASRLSLVACFDRQVRLHGSRIAIESDGLEWTYAGLDRRAGRMAARLVREGVGRGDRIAMLSENDPDFLVLAIAALRLGAAVATLNPRLARAELEHCIALVGPRVLLQSSRMQQAVGSFETLVDRVVTIGAGSPLRSDLDADDESSAADIAAPTGDAEDIQFIIYTSGTTGLPKAAMISQRAMLARLMVYVIDYRVDGDDTFLAWSPLCHMASIELGFGTLLRGGKVVVLDGADLPTICDHLEREPISNLIFFPGMVEQAIDYLRRRKPAVRGLKKFGALADLFNPDDIAELTRLLGVPYTNTFGSTETGMAPASAGELAIGVPPLDLAKAQSALCEVRICREDGSEAATGEIGELAMRGPTLFSGYWAAPAATLEAFHDGWYRSGDMFRRRADGLLEYVDRRKYLIKSGGENIYPAEIERVLMRHPQVADAVAIRRRDARWGEVPVVVAVAHGTRPDDEELLALCREHLAPFKRPRQVIWVEPDELPRNHTGKVIRAELERWLEAR
ncbi:long-chain fatty acid--CoA ligase [soil metagenome]